MPDEVSLIYRESLCILALGSVRRACRDHLDLSRFL